MGIEEGISRSREVRRYVKYGTAAAVFCLPFIVYVLTLAPSITFGDSGEFVTVAALFGNAHPSGYPLYALYAHIFALIPLGGLAWRINLASAFAAAAAAVVLFFILENIFSSKAEKKSFWPPAAAAAGALFFAFGYSLWGQALVAEVYALNVFLLAVIVFVTYIWTEREDGRYGFLFAFLSGLALTCHTSSVLIVIVAGFYAGVRFKRPPAWRDVFFGVVLFLLGFSVYLYTPIRAAAGPEFNWGEPRTLTAVIDHVSRKAYGGIDFARYRYRLGEFIYYCKTVLVEYTLPGSAVIAAGIFAAFKRRFRFRWFLAVSAVVTGPISTAGLVGMLQTHQLDEIYVWFIPGFFFVAIFAGVAIFAAGEIAVRKYAVPVRGTLCLLFVLPLAVNWRKVDKSDYFFALDYGENYLETIGYEGVSFIYEVGSLGAFETAYLKMAERMRPDQDVVDASGFVYRGHEVFSDKRRTLIENGDFFGLSAWEREYELEVFADAINRGVYYSYWRNEVIMEGYELIPYGMLYRVYLGSQPDVNNPIWEHYKFRGVSELKKSNRDRQYIEDVWSRIAVSKYDLMRAESYFDSGNAEDGVEYALEAAEISEGLPIPTLNVAELLAEKGFPELAEPLFEGAITSYRPEGKRIDDPLRLYPKIWRQLILAHLYRGDAESADKSYSEFKAVVPGARGVPDYFEGQDWAVLSVDLKAKNDAVLLRYGDFVYGNDWLERAEVAGKPLGWSLF
jgi:tetratricopeptide (TPR) repeat protein